MKKSFLALALVAAVSLAGCFEDALVVKVPAGYSAEFTIEAPVAAGAQARTESSKIITDNEDFKKLNVSVDNVESAKLTELVLTISSPEGTTFEALKSAKFSIKDAAGTEIVVANIPEAMDKTSNTLTVELYDEELAAFIKSGEISLIGDYEILSDITEDIRMKADLKCDIKVNPTK
jgi:hypothetical protein